MVRVSYRTRQFVCSYELGHRYVTKPEACEFVGFSKWRPNHLQIKLFQAGFPTYSSSKVFCVWTEECNFDVSFCRGKLKTYP